MWRNRSQTVPTQALNYARSSRNDIMNCFNGAFFMTGAHISKSTITTFRQFGELLLQRHAPHPQTLWYHPTIHCRSISTTPPLAASRPSRRQRRSKKQQHANKAIAAAKKEQEKQAQSQQPQQPQQSSQSPANSKFIVAARPKDETPYEYKMPLPDPEKEKVLTQLQSQMMEYYHQAKYRRALQSAKDLLEQTTAHYQAHPVAHPAVASAYSNIGLFHKLLGNFNESRLSYQKALQMYQTTVGPDHASTASVLHNLGTLNRVQLQLDDTLKRTERLTLLEDSLAFLEQAFRIRLAERGPHHPHTISSRSGWGASGAASILYHHEQLTKSSSHHTATTTTTKLLPSRVLASQRHVTVPAWDAAEEHLRDALRTALAHPRGRSVLGQETERFTKRAGTKVATKGPHDIAAILAEKEKEKMALNNVKDDSHDGNDSLDNVQTEDDSSLDSSTPLSLPVLPMQTLSAAAAGQNLAIFLKARATLVHSTATASTEPSVPRQEQRDAWLREADQLYQDVLRVRQALLPPNHPDIYATQHSRAELLHVMGQEDAANVIRQEILDSISPPEKTVKNVAVEQNVPETVIVESVETSTTITQQATSKEATLS